MTQVVGVFVVCSEVIRSMTHILRSPLLDSPCSPGLSATRKGTSTQRGHKAEQILSLASVLGTPARMVRKRVQTRTASLQVPSGCACADVQQHFRQPALVVVAGILLYAFRSGSRPRE